MTQITLRPLPPSVNHMYSRGRGGRMFKTQEAKDIQDEYGWQCKEQTRDFYIGPISVEIIAYFADNRRRDADNLAKVTLDSLTNILWEDDSQILDLTIRKRFDKLNPRLDLIIKDIK